MNTTSGTNGRAPTQGEAGEGRKILLGPVARALMAMVLLAIAGLVLMSVLGRPESVSFVSSFKCERFSPGSVLDLSFEDCKEVKFRAHGFQIPRESYKPAKNKDTEERGLEVGIEGDGLVTAELSGDYKREASVTIGRNGVIELHPSKEATGPGEFRVSSEKLGLSMGAWGFTLTTPSDGHFAGFADGVSKSLIGTMEIDEFEESQGGVPPMVGISVSGIVGPVSIRGDKDEIAGWSPISLLAGPSQKPLDLENGRLWAEKVSSYELSVNGKPVDMGTAIDRLQIDVVKASLTKLALHQDASDGYIEVVISGVSRSIKQNNKEVIESVISRLLSQPSYKNGLAGLSLVLIIFAGGIFLKRALDILAETWLPKS